MFTDWQEGMKELQTLTPSDDRYQELTEQLEFLKSRLLEAMFLREIPFPWANGGMAIDISTGKCAGAVMNAGGIGVTTGTLCGPNQSQETINNSEIKFDERVNIVQNANKTEAVRQVEIAREKSPFGILGVNVMHALPDFEAVVRAICDTKKIDILYVGAGIPKNLPKIMADYPDVKFITIVSEENLPKFMEKIGKKEGSREADGYYFEISKFAGGHKGRQDENRSPKEILEQIRLVIGEEKPVLMGGGVMYGSDILEAFKSGIDGVIMGLRTLLTQKSNAPDEILKEFYLDPEKTKTATVRTSPTGLTSCINIANQEEFDAERKNIEKYIRSRCVSCINHKRCQFFTKKNPESYCIGHHLSAFSRGARWSLMFASNRLEEILTDSLYTKNGERYIPTIPELVAYIQKTVEHGTTWNPEKKGA